MHSGRRQLEQKPIVKFYLIKQIKRGATRTYRVTKPILSNCLHGSKTSLTGITSNTYKSATISKPQFQEFGNKYLLTGQPTHTVSKIKILNVTMKKTSRELNQLNQQQNKITDDKLFSLTYCPSLSSVCAGASPFHR